MQEYANIGNVSEVVKQYSCPHRKIVAEYEKTVAQMIGELVPPSGHRLLGKLELPYLKLAQILNKYMFTNTNNIIEVLYATFFSL